MVEWLNGFATWLSSEDGQGWIKVGTTMVNLLTGAVGMVIVNRVKKAMFGETSDEVSRVLNGLKEAPLTEADVPILKGSDHKATTARQEVLEIPESDLFVCVCPPKEQGFIYECDDAGTLTDTSELYEPHERSKILLAAQERARAVKAAERAKKRRTVADRIPVKKKA
jgi:hypothetical protein